MTARWITDSGSHLVEVRHDDTHGNYVAISEWTGQAWKFQALIWPLLTVSPAILGDYLLQEIGRYLDPADLIETTPDRETDDWKDQAMTIEYTA